MGFSGVIRQPASVRLLKPDRLRPSALALLLAWSGLSLDFAISRRQLAILAPNTDFSLDYGAVEPYENTADTFVASDG